MTQLRPVLTTQGEKYAVAAIVVQESPDGAAVTGELTELAARLADEARRLLQEERPGATVSAAVAISAPAPAPVVTGADADPAPVSQVSGEIEVDRASYVA